LSYYVWTQALLLSGEVHLHASHLSRVFSQALCQRFRSSSLPSQLHNICIGRGSQ
jgi:hypothetical protein